MRDPKIDELAACELFRGLTNRELKSLGRMCTKIIVAEGSNLVAQGRRGEECFVLASGRAEVLVDGEPVATVHAGELVGEVSMLDRGLRTATVVAATPVEAWVFDANQFAELLSAFPVVSRKVFASLTKRLRRADRALAGAH